MNGQFNWVLGTQFSDTLIGTPGNDYIVDSNNFQATADSISGGDGDDWIGYEGYSATITGGDGNDKIFPDSRSAIDFDIDSGSGNDFIHFDLLHGFYYESIDRWRNLSDDPDVVQKSEFKLGDGNDRITGVGLGVSVLGGDGNDEAHLAATITSIDLGSGDDFLNLIQHPTPQLTSAVISGGDGFDTLYATRRAFHAAHIIKNFEVLLFEYPDYPVKITIEQLAAFERIEARGDESVDIELASGGLLDISSFVGTDGARLAGSVESDTLIGGAGDDTLYGTIDYDFDSYTKVSIQKDRDLLQGGLGNDRFYLMDGRDTFMGGDGFDTIFLASVYVEGDRSDRFRFDDSRRPFIVEWRGNRLSVDGREEMRVFSVEALRTGNWSDTISASGGDRAIYSAAGNDSITTGTGNDTLSGYTDNDTLSAGAGNDSLDGSWGDDLLIADAGNDTLSGYTDNDTLSAGAGNDSLDGSWGDDLLIADAGNDTFDGGRGTDTVSFGAERALLLDLATGNHSGSASGDRFTSIEHFIGSARNDQMLGDATDNHFSGGAGRDTLSGAAGNDRLDGGAGNDHLTGGTGRDVFAFAEAPRTGGRDTIADFVRGEDKIEIDASAFGGGLVAGGKVTLVASLWAVRGAGPVFIYDAATGVLSVDLDGARGFDAAFAFAQFTGAPALTASDFTIVA